MSSVRPITVRHPHLSLWQSAVTAVVRRGGTRKNAPALATPQVHRHPMVRSALAHVLAVQGGSERNPKVAAARLDAAARCSMLHHEIAEAVLAGDTRRVAALREECRAFATCNTAAWLNCENVYLEYRLKYKTLQYRDWKTDGKGRPDYGVIPWLLPDDAKVGLVADWGTGTDDASALLEEMMNRGVDVILHLGDIYYAGTPDECQAIGRQIQEVFQRVGRKVPVFMIPGNHDYYALGHGFYPLIDVLNRDLPDAGKYRQEASYFCLRTAGGRFQLLGMDTGQDDYAPLNATNPTVAGPALRASEVEWHRHKLATFEGETILLSHHQLFSTNAAINGKASGQSPAWLNNSLLDTFAPAFARVPVWFWGHEHNLVLYQDGFRGLAKGRLIGCAGYEEAGGESPYRANHPVPYLPPVNPKTGEPMTRLGVSAGYYNHGYAILDLASREVSYYQMPSWGGTTRTKLPPTQQALLLVEKLDAVPINLLNFVPPGLVKGHRGRWDGSLTGAPATWFSLNKVSGSPRVQQAGATELRIAGAYDFIGTPSWRNPTGRRRGSIDLRIWNIGPKSTCSLRVAVTGPLAEEYLGRTPFDSGDLPLTCAASADGSLTCRGGKNSLRLLPFPKDAIWYPGIQFNVTVGGRSLFLCFEDLNL